MKIVYKADRDKAAIMKAGVAFALLALLLASVISGNSMAADAAANAKTAPGVVGFFFTYLSNNPFVFLFLSLALGYPLGWITIKGISLGTAGFSNVGILPMDIRAYKVENEELVGQTVEELYRKYPHAAVLKVVRGDEVIDATDNPTLQMGDVIGIRGRYEMLIDRGEKGVGTEVDESRARSVEIEVADVHVGKSEYAGKTLEELGKSIAFGVNLNARIDPRLYRDGYFLIVNDRMLLSIQG